MRMDYKTSFALLRAGLWIGLLVALIGTNLKNMIVTWIGLGLVLAGIVQALIFYRCPNCGKHLKLSTRGQEKCPKCGCALEGK